MFKALGISEQEAEEKFGSLLGDLNTVLHLMAVLHSV
jgi:aspartyl-tRNA synthetase